MKGIKRGVRARELEASPTTHLNPQLSPTIIGYSLRLRWKGELPGV